MVKFKIGKQYRFALSNKKKYYDAFFEKGNKINLNKSKLIHLQDEIFVVNNIVMADQIPQEMAIIAYIPSKDITFYENELFLQSNCIAIKPNYSKIWRNINEKI